MEQREKLIEILSQYFTIGDSDEYSLIRDKSAFAIGTMSLDDFVEFDEEKVADIADYLFAHNVVVLPCKVGDTVYVINHDTIIETKCYSIVTETEDNHFIYILTCKLSPTLDSCVSLFVKKIFGKTVFLSFEEAEAALTK